MSFLKWSLNKKWYKGKTWYINKGSSTNAKAFWNLSATQAWYLSKKTAQPFSRGKKYVKKRIIRDICSCAIKVRECFEMRFNRLEGSLFHTLMYISTSVNIFSYKKEKLCTKSQHLHCQCMKLRSRCRSYSEGARHFAFFSEKMTPSTEIFRYRRSRRISPLRPPGTSFYYLRGDFSSKGPAGWEC